MLKPASAVDDLAQHHALQEPVGVDGVGAACDGGYVTGDCLTVDGGEWLRNGGEFSYATDYDRDAVKQMFKAMRGKEK